MKLVSKEKKQSLLDKFHSVKSNMHKIEEAIVGESKMLAIRLRANNPKSDSTTQFKQYGHDLNIALLKDKLKQLGAHPIAKSVRKLYGQSSKFSLDQIDENFENCISYKILGDKELNLRRKKHKAVDMGRMFKEMPDGSVINSLKFSLNNYKRMLTGAREHTASILNSHSSSMLLANDGVFLTGAHAFIKRNKSNQKFPLKKDKFPSFRSGRFYLIV